MKLKETNTGWVVINIGHPYSGSKYILSESFAFTKKGCIKDFIKDTGQTWKYWRDKYNFRCVRAEMKINTFYPARRATTAMIDSETVISFSGGRTSAFMTIELLKDERYRDAVVIFANTGKENEATLNFVKRVNEYIGGRIIWLEYNPDPEIWFNIVTHDTASRKGEPFEALIGKRKYLPNRVARFCTQDLKIMVMKKYCQRVLGWKNWTNMVGIRYDEPNRWAKSKSVERNEVFDVEHPLVRWKVTKPQVLEIWRRMPFNLEIEDYEGNCDLCFLKGKKKKQMIARKTPERFDWWIDQERKVNGTFVKEYSYEQLFNAVKESPLLFTDDDIECFCNID
jgi:3'-phosphoadenosine 5'-phosphosulfate sulfotransferase (PAPS reductase)/FAD synthetase